jgi:predicted PurR-regulated permease PerM
VLISAAVIIAGLYFAREVILPIALAVLISFLLAPLVNRLERWRLGRVPSVVIVVMLTLAVLATVSFVVAKQTLDLAERLPDYRQNIKDKMQRLRQSGGKFGRSLQGFEVIQEEVIAPRPASVPASTQAAALDPNRPPLKDAVMTVAGEKTDKPIAVEVMERKPPAIQSFRTNVAPWLAPIGTAGVVVVFVVFMLLQRQDLRDRIIRLLSTRAQLTITTQAMDDAATRISRYLLMQLVVNVTYGIPIGIGLWAIDVPKAFLWGLLATLLRFIPYIGPWIAAIPPLLLAFAAFPGWWPLILTVALFITVELISNNVVEPWLYGASTGLSPTAILISAVFWTWLWGPVGLLMSTPLTVCLVVLGKYVPRLGFLDILLGDEPVMSLPMRVYQRLLAFDQEEATDLIDEHIAKETKPLAEVYDEVLVPALRMAERDRHDGKLDEDRQQFIRRAMKEIVEDLGDRHELPDTQVSTTAEAGRSGNGDSEAAAQHDQAAVICLPARDEADEIVGMMVSQILEKNGVRARHASVTSLASEMVEAVDRTGANFVCISALPPSAVAHARYLCKRLRVKRNDLTLVIGLWTSKIDAREIQAKLGCGDNDRVVTSIADAVAHLRPLLHIEASVQG